MSRKGSLFRLHSTGRISHASGYPWLEMSTPVGHKTKSSEDPKQTDVKCEARAGTGLQSQLQGGPGRKNGSEFEVEHRKGFVTRTVRTPHTHY